MIVLAGLFSLAALVWMIPLIRAGSVSLLGTVVLIAGTIFWTATNLLEAAVVDALIIVATLIVGLTLRRECTAAVETNLLIAAILVEQTLGTEQHACLVKSGSRISELRNL